MNDTTDKPKRTIHYCNRAQIVLAGAGGLISGVMIERQNWTVLVLFAIAMGVVGLIQGFIMMWRDHRVITSKTQHLDTTLRFTSETKLRDDGGRTLKPSIEVINEMGVTRSDTPDPGDDA